MYKDLKETLKADIANVRAGKRDNGSDWRRHMHLALSFLRGTPYRRCEADPKEDARGSTIRVLLQDYGFDQESLGVDEWVGFPPVTERPAKISRLYTVVRADLPPGAQAVQASHAMLEFNYKYPEISAEWHKTSNTVAILSVPNELALKLLADKLESYGIEMAEFLEPDLGNSLTAVTFEPRAGGLLRNLPLAMRDLRLAQQELNLRVRG